MGLTTEQEHAEELRRTDILVFLLILAALLIVAVAGFTAQHKLTAFVATLSAIAGGGILGLVFAVPKLKSLSGSPQEAAGGEKSSYASNTSLEDISDWFSKALIGAAAVTWDSLLLRLDNSGTALGVAVFGPGPAALPGGVALIIGPSALSFLAAYLWFKRYLAQEWSDADTEASARNYKRQAAGLRQQPDLPPGAGAGPGAGPSAPGPGGPAPAPAPSGATAKEASAFTADPLEQAIYDKYALLRTAPKHPDDWVKGMFGGSNQVVNGHGTRSISATVTQASKSWFEVTIVVRANPAPNEGVCLFLHNTFPSSTNRLSFDESGAATLKLDCYGAFTIGALMDGGETELEIDLADAPGANARFKSR